MEGGLGARIFNGTAELAQFKNVDLGKLAVAQVMPPPLKTPVTPDRRVAIFMRSNGAQAGSDKLVYDELVVMNADDDYPKTISPTLKINETEMRASCRIIEPKSGNGIAK
jgi:hypothetical protein